MYEERTRICRKHKRKSRVKINKQKIEGMIKFKKKNGRKNKTSTDTRKRRQKQALGNEGKNKDK